MNRVVLLIVAFFLLSAALFAYTLMSADKLDRYFESIRAQELLKKHQGIGVFAASELSSGTLLLRTMLDEHVVELKELKPNSVRSLDRALNRPLLRSVHAGDMLTEDQLGPVQKDTQE